MNLRRDDIRILNKHRRVDLLVSGGRDSTAGALLFKDHEPFLRTEIRLLHTNTGNRLKTAVQTLNKLQEFTGWPLVVLDTKDYLDQTPRNLIIESFQFLNKAKTALKEGKYSKNIFPCCYWLKHKPFEQWLKINDHSDAVFVSFIRGGESSYRQTIHSPGVIWLLYLSYSLTFPRGFPTV